MVTEGSMLDLQGPWPDRGPIVPLQQADSGLMFNMREFVSSQATW